MSVLSGLSDNLGSSDILGSDLNIDLRSFCTRIGAVNLLRRSTNGSWRRITWSAAWVLRAAAPTTWRPRASLGYSNANEWIASTTDENWGQSGYISLHRARSHSKPAAEA